MDSLISVLLSRTKVLNLQKRWNVKQIGLAYNEKCPESLIPGISL